MDTARVMPGETFQYELKVIGSGAQSTAMNPSFPDFQAAGFSANPSLVRGGRRENINGAITEYKYYQIQLKAPAREGTYKIPAARVAVSGVGVLASNEVTVTVAKPPTTSIGKIRSATTGNSNYDRLLANRLFLVATVDKTEAYVGEQITVRYDLYQALNLNAGFNKVNYPNVNYRNFRHEVVSRPNEFRSRREVVNGVTFNVTHLLTNALFPNRSGKLTFDEEVAVLIREQFFDSVVAHLPYEPIEINVLPLPIERRPADFTGAVGDFTMTVSLDPLEVTQYDIVTLKLEISGDGLYDSLPKPSIPAISGLMKTKELDSATQSSGARFGGTKTFEVLYRTTATGTLTFPTIEYPIFHPGEGKYKRLKTEPLTLHILPAPESERPSLTVYNPADPGGVGLAPSPVVTIDNDIEYIRTSGFLRNGPTAEPLYESPGFLLFQLVPIGLVAVSFVVRRRRAQLEGDVALARRRSARSVAARRLRGARTKLSAGEGDAFFVELARALRQFAADQLNESAAGMTTDEMKEALLARGVEETHVDELTALLDLCESTRYAGEQASDVEMREAILRASQTIDRLAKSMK